MLINRGLRCWREHLLDPNVISPGQDSRIWYYRRKEILRPEDLVMLGLTPTEVKPLACRLRLLIVLSSLACRLRKILSCPSCASGCGLEPFDRLPGLVPLEQVQEFLGCPNRPCTKTMLIGVNCQ